MGSLFQYCKVNVPGPGCELALFEEQFEGCECKGLCDTNTCPCVMQFGQRYDMKGRLLHSVDSATTEQKPVLECNKACQCLSSCGQRLTQHGVQHHLEVFDTKVKGLGLRTLEKIDRSSFVCEYAGEVLSADESRKRAEKQKESDMNYILVLNEHCSSGVWKTCIDPEHIGNVGRFINHSCSPNLFMVPVRVDNNVPKLSLFAQRDIYPGEELSFNYAGNLSVETAKREVDQTARRALQKPCLCGTPNCMGFLPFQKSLYEQ